MRLEYQTSHFPFIEAYNDQRANLGDPLFVQGLDEYQKEMVNDTTAAGIRSRLKDATTLAVKDYDPKGLESLET